ncbi:MAG: outer membrane beta-barrel protein, partial [Bryobacteraceae bacterium]
MPTRLSFRSLNSLAVAATLCFCASGFCTSAYAQGTNNTSKGSTDEYPDVIELDPFGGVSLIGQVNRGLDEQFIKGGTGGGRVTYNISNHIGIEASYNFTINNVRLVTPIAPGLPSYDFHEEIHYPALNVVFNLKPRGSKVQPYLIAGVGPIFFKPHQHYEQIAREPAVDAIYHSANLGENTQVAFNYGGGIKFHLSEHLGLRFDARGFYSRNPTFRLPNYNDGGIYIVSGQHINGFQGTVGLVLYLGQRAIAAPAPVVTPPPAPLNAGDITGGQGTLCPGKPITLHSTASDPAAHTLTYAWKLNGMPSGANSADFSFTPNNAGDFTVQVTVSDSTNPSRTVTAGPITLTVKEYAEPRITSVTATPNALSCAADTNGTHTSSLSGQATGSACGGNLSYKWTVSEGSVTNDTSPNATFDASTLNFEGGAQGQTKTVTATLTVTDETGKSASQSTDIIVKCPPQFVRLPDVVFSKNNARVNNCGKRILIDEAAPRLSSGDYDIVLV